MERGAEWDERYRMDHQTSRCVYGNGRNASYEQG